MFKRGGIIGVIGLVINTRFFGFFPKHIPGRFLEKSNLPLIMDFDWCPARYPVMH